MYSYPNYIPLNRTQIHNIMECLDPLAYDRVQHSSVRSKGIVPTNGREVVRRPPTDISGPSGLSKDKSTSKPSIF